MVRHLELEDVAALQLPSDPSVTPDGRQVVYVLRTTDTSADCDRFALWSVRADGDGWGEPTALTQGDNDTAPAVAPDGTQVAFLRGSDRSQLHVLSLRGGEARKLTDLPGGAGAPVWSPDGNRIAFTAPVRTGPTAGDANPEKDQYAPISTTRLGYKADGLGYLGPVRAHLHVLDVATGQVRQVSDGDWHAGGPAWSRDGTRLAFAAAPDDDADITLRSSAFVLEVGTGGPPRRVGSGRGTAGAVLFSADGQSLFVAGQTRVGVSQISLLRMDLLDAAADGVDVAAALDRNVMPGGPGYPGGLPQRSPDGGEVVFCVRDGGCSHVWAVPADGSAPPRAVLTGEDQMVSGLSVATGSDLAAVVVGDPTTYGEVAILPLDGGEPVRLTAHTAASVPGVSLLRPEPRTFTVHDGTEVHGWVLCAADAPTPGPLLLDVHGGPHNAWSPAADAAHPCHQVLAARGWTVLLLNPRGSDGYGNDSWAATVDAWGLADERDLLDPIDELIEEGLVDPARLAVTGYSYGGYMTCWLTGRTDRFAAAVGGGVVADLVGQWGVSDVGPAMGGLEWPNPFTDPEALAACSPWSRVGSVTTPTLVLQGKDDQRCPAAQAEQWFAALRSREVPTEMVLYPGSSHLFILNGRPSHRADYNRRLIDWMEQHMGTTTRTAKTLRLDADHWQQRLQALAARHGVVGASLAIRRLAGSGEPGATDELVEVAAGVLNKSTGDPVTPDSVFQIGSISKVWTTTLVMQLVDEGKLSLDAPIVDVLPELRLGDTDVAGKVTMRHLVTHSSGIDGDVFTDTGRGDDCLEKYVAALADVAQNHPLGATFSYCNSGFVLAGRVIEVLTGKTWDTVLRERIIEPLGLEFTSTLPEEAVLHRVAVGHITPDPEQDPEVVKTFLMPRPLGPAGLISATAADVTSFARMHLLGGVASDGTRVLSGGSTEAMQAHELDLPDKHTLGDSWGLGWIRFDWNGERLYGHDGSTFGQNAYLKVLPSQGLSVALLTNGGHTTDLYRDLYQEVFSEVAGLDMPEQLTPPDQAPTPAPETGRLVGTYERSSVTTEVFEGDDGLVLRIIPTGATAEASGATTEELTLHPVEENLFVTQPPGQESWMPVTFYQLPDGSDYVHYGARANPKKG